MTNRNCIDDYRDSIVTEGREAYKNNHDKDENPYEYHTPEYDLWLLGWKEAYDNDN